MTDLPDIYPQSIGDEMYVDALPLVDMYGDPNQNLWVYLHALAVMLQPVDDICKDGPNGEPGWSQIFDLTRAKTSWLPWVGQLNGYAVPPKPDSQTLEYYDANQRERIVTRRADLKGTTELLIAQVGDQLNPPKRVIVQERYQGDASQIRVWVYEEDIATSQAEVQKAALAAKFSGLLMTFAFIPPTATYQELLATHLTYQVVKNTFDSYTEVLTSPGTT